MTDTVIQSRIVLPVGSRSFGPVAIPSSIVWAGFVFSKANWTDPAVKLTLQIDTVVDGQSLSLGGFVNEPGGGADVSAAFKIPPGTARTVTGSVIVSGGPLDTVVSARTLVAGEGRVLP